MRGSTKIFRIFGIDIKLHFSWWFIFIFLSWVLTTSFFPVEFPGYTSGQYWFMGITAAFFLFISVLLHELSHSLVAKARKIKVEDITLFFFGGVAGITKEDMKPSSEFFMAIAGPVFSLFLAGVFYLLFKTISGGLWTPIVYYLAFINFVLAVFNLIPGFPLDGGRAFRALLYAYYKDLKKATYIASRGGRFFGVFLMIVGVISLFTGTGGGLWFVLIGGFLYFIAGLSYEQVVLKEVLSKVPVKDILIKHYVTLLPEMSFYELVNKYVNSEEDTFAVKGKDYSGILDIKTLDKIPPKMQPMVRIKQLAISLDKANGVKITDNAYTAFKKFVEGNTETLPVLKDSKLIGFVSKKMVMHRLVWALKYDFNGRKAALNKNKQKP